MKRSYGYDSYRGRSGARTFLKIVVIVLVLALVGLGVWLLFLTERYSTYSDQGMKLELPWNQSTPSAPPTAAASAPPLVVVSQAPPSPEPAQALTVRKLTAADLHSADTAERLKTLGANAALVDMKTIDGALGYVSSLPEMATLNSSAADDGVNEAIARLNAAEELHTIARVACFRDNSAPRRRNSIALRTASGNWFDAESNRWLNIGNPEARAYLVGVCGELAALGFDEILLDYACYPTNGRTTSIKVGETYDPQGLDKAVEAFYQEVAQALADYPDVKLSIVADPSLLTGENPVSGQTGELLDRYADRVWYAPAEGVDAAQALGISQEKLAPMTDPASQTGELPLITETK